MAPARAQKPDTTTAARYVPLGASPLAPGRYLVLVRADTLTDVHPLTVVR